MVMYVPWITSYAVSMSYRLIEMFSFGHLLG